MRVLLIEGDAQLGNALRMDLEQQGHTVNWQLDAGAAEATALKEEFEIGIVDARSAREGIALLRRIRTNGKALPAIVVVNREDIADCADGLEPGDDFIVKPFDLLELSARLRAMLRRGGRFAGDGAHGMLKLDASARTVSLDDKLVPLTVREFSILNYLLEHRGRVMSKQQLQEATYTWSDEIESNTVEVHVHHLRRKLGRELIKTMHGMGYTIDNRVQTR